jgi:hypothetical protein
MAAYIREQDYYLDFINNSEQDLNDYISELSLIAAQKENLHNDIANVENDIKKFYGINLSDYRIEWIFKKYNEDNLSNKIKMLINSNYDNEHVDLLFMLNKYLLMLKKEYDINRRIIAAKKRKNITPDEYKQYLKKFYYKVHEFLLQGQGYQFTNGIGIVCVNYWKMTEDEKKRPYLDFYETKKAKKALIEKGLRPYSAKEAREYAKQGIPYDGVPYAVYKKEDSYYEIRLTNTYINGITKLIFTKIEHVDAKLKGMTFKEIADNYVNSFEDIVNLGVSLKNKVSIMKLKYPNSYLKFIRTTDGYRLKPNKY